MSTSSDPPPRAPRSQFLQKLHGLLEHPLDSTGLRWVTDDSFEVSSKDAVAIHALSPAFEFNSLSSFIRQLSYYSFRRLSDRRRSTERRSSNTGYILFTHPSGFFVRGDPSKLNEIVRKPRNRPEKGRRVSTTSSMASDEMPVTYEPPAVPHLPAWTSAPEYQRPPFSARTSVNLPSLSSSFASRNDFVQWRNYAPTTGGWLDPNRADASERFSATPRRSSLGDFKLAAPTFSSGLPGVQEARPPLRKAASSLTVQTQNLVPEQPYFQPASEDCQPGIRPSPYPTPTFSPTTNTFFTATNGSAHDYYAAPAAGPAWTPAQHVQQHSHVAYDPSPFPPAYQPVAPSKITPSHDQLSYHTPSPDASPLQSTASLPGINHFDAAQPHLVGGGVVPSSNYLLGSHTSVGGGGYSQVSALSSSPSRTYFSTQQQPAWSPAPIRTSYV
ncbi:hypothetical protein JCM10021v2_007324 [Rhodotorula toruloides]|uniref:HSF-type DNA-binding domain-containing protein n=1 Tax=Rhodotorula toruloides TaxID=5286 RepID=A0A2S9ZYA4_RHOTO|nr:hypothetical protein AAT19DRAFT_10884 [Rhodotorula toruloides]